MRYQVPLIEVRLLRRYKRFLADVQMNSLPEGASQLPDEETGCFTVHCANPGSMKGLARAGARAWIYDSQNPKRKLRYSLELIETEDGAIVCINTARANALISEALHQGIIEEISPHICKPEVNWDDPRSGSALKARFDFAIWESEGSATHPPSGYVEVKSVTYAPNPVEQPGLVAFPDSVTARGLKHLNALIAVRRAGQRAVLLFCVNRNDAQSVTIADDIDPDYAAKVIEAIDHGVEVIAYRVQAAPHEQVITKRIPFRFMYCS